MGLGKAGKLVVLEQTSWNLEALGAAGVGGTRAESAIRFANWLTFATGDALPITRGGGAEGAAGTLRKSKLSTSRVIGETARGRGHLRGLFGTAGVATVIKLASDTLEFVECLSNSRCWRLASGA